MATYQMPRTTDVRHTGRVLGVLLLLAASLGVGFDVGRVTAPAAKSTPVTSLQRGDVNEPAWHDQLHTAMNRLAADHAHA